MSKPSELIKAQPSKGNPFLSIQNFTCLEQNIDTKGKHLPDVIDTVAEHMVKNNIPSATIICSGVSGKSKRHLVNLQELKKVMPVDFGNVTSMHPLVHMESRNYPDVVVLKSGATSRLLN